MGWMERLGWMAAGFVLAYLLSLVARYRANRQMDELIRQTDDILATCRRATNTPTSQPSDS